MEALKLLSQALDKATQKGCFNLDECALILNAVRELSEKLKDSASDALIGADDESDK